MATDDPLVIDYAHGAEAPARPPRQMRAIVVAWLALLSGVLASVVGFRYLQNAYHPPPAENSHGPPAGFPAFDIQLLPMAIDVTRFLVNIVGGFMAFVFATKAMRRSKAGSDARQLSCFAIAAGLFAWFGLAMRIFYHAH